MSVLQGEALAAALRLLERYPDGRSGVMPLLYMVSRAEGHVSDAGMRQVAELTGLTPAQVLSVASFYTMFKRDEAGKYLLSVCTSISCFLLGADDVLAAVADETGVPDGETSSDGMFSVEHAECIGACGGAPAVQVNYELIEGVSADKARALCRWLRDGRPHSVLSDEMQALFGGACSFEWGPPEPRGSAGPYPAFAPYGTAEESK
jgi:NADH:ubiquinone oxidoreductase subunit E